MSKRKSVLPKAPTPVARLQQERKQIQARLSSRLVLLSDPERKELGLRLIEVKRQLNGIYAAGL